MSEAEQKTESGLSPLVRIVFSAQRRSPTRTVIPTCGCDTKAYILPPLNSTTPSPPMAGLSRREYQARLCTDWGWSCPCHSARRTGPSRHPAKGKHLLSMALPCNPQAEVRAPAPNTQGPWASPIQSYAFHMTDNTLLLAHCGCGVNICLADGTEASTDVFPVYLSPPESPPTTSMAI